MATPEDTNPWAKAEDIRLVSGPIDIKEAFADL